MQDFLKNRRVKLFNLINHHSIAALLITTPENISYLTGISPISRSEREIYLLATNKQLHAFVSPLSFETFAHLKQLQIHQLSSENRLTNQLAEILPSKGGHLWIEANNLTYQEAHMFKERLKLTLKPSPPLIEQMRMIKDASEIKTMSRIGHITAKVFEQIRPQIQPGMTEIYVASQLRNLLESNGATGLPYGFEPIVAFGNHSAIPHHKVTSRQLRANEAVLIDFGGQLDGYAADFTRTFFVGQPPEEFLKIERIVKKAYAQAFGKIRAQINTSQIDKQVRQVFAQADYEQYYSHTAGHGLGLSVHESPSLYHQHTQEILDIDMIITLEPGLYLPQLFGYRYEDTILVAADTGTILTK